MTTQDPYAELHKIDTFICDRGGRVLINKAKFAQKLYMLESEPSTLSVAANDKGRCSLRPPGDQGGLGDVEVHSLGAESTGTFAVELYDVAGQRRFMNQPVESTLVFGNGVTPGRLPATVLIPATNTLDAEITDLSGGANAVLLYALGSQIVDANNFLGADPMAAARAAIARQSHPYWLTFDDGAQVTVGANATSTFNMTVPQGAHLEMWAILHRSTSTFDFEIIEGSRRSLMNATIPHTQLGVSTRTIAGFPGGVLPAAAQTGPLPFTHVFQSRTVVQVKITDTSGAQNTISMALAGQLLYQEISTQGISQPSGY